MGKFLTSEADCLIPADFITSTGFHTFCLCISSEKNLTRRTSYTKIPHFTILADSSVLTDCFTSAYCYTIAVTQTLRYKGILPRTPALFPHFSYKVLGVLPRLVKGLDAISCGENINILLPSYLYYCSGFHHPSKERGSRTTFA